MVRRHDKRATAKTRRSWTQADEICDRMGILYRIFGIAAHPISLNKHKRDVQTTFYLQQNGGITDAARLVVILTIPQ